MFKSDVKGDRRPIRTLGFSLRPGMMSVFMKQFVALFVLAFAPKFLYTSHCDTLRFFPGVSPFSFFYWLIIR